MQPPFADVDEEPQVSSLEHPGQGIVGVTTFVLLPPGHLGQAKVVWMTFVVTGWLEELAFVLDEEDLTEDELDRNGDEEVLEELEIGLHELDDEDRETDELVVDAGDDLLLDDREVVVITLRLEVLDMWLLNGVVVVFFWEVEKEGVEDILEDEEVLLD